MKLRRQVGQAHRTNKGIKRAVENTQPLTWAMLSNELKGYRRFFSEQWKFREMYKKVEEAFKWTTSSTLEGENRVWIFLLRSLNDKSIVPNKEYEHQKKWVNLYHMLWNMSRFEKAAESPQRSKMKKYRKEIDEKLFRELFRMKEYKHKNGEPNWSRLGRAIGLSENQAKTRAIDLGIHLNMKNSY
jgi:hypothetical protein